MSASCDRIVNYIGRDGWGNARRATYPLPDGATAPRTLVRFGTTLYREDIADTHTVEWKHTIGEIVRPVRVSP
jgi:hypothetical protein